MTTAIEKHQGTGEIVVAGLTREQVGLVKRTICAGYTDDELRMFLYQADRLGLDPLSREAYTFKTRDGRVVIGIGIDGLRRRAEETGCYAPGRATTFEVDDQGKLLSASAYVQKWHAASGQWLEVAETAYMTESRGRSPNWQNAPRMMLSKVAEARALRRAFPSRLTEAYLPEEEDEIRAQPVAPPPYYPDAVVDSPLASPLTEEQREALQAPVPTATVVEPDTQAEADAEAEAEEKRRTRRTRCNDCGKLWGPGIVVNGQCERCRAQPEPELPPEPDQDPAPEISRPPARPASATTGQAAPVSLSINAMVREAMQGGAPAAAILGALHSRWPDADSRTWTADELQEAGAIIAGAR